MSGNHSSNYSSEPKKTFGVSRSNGYNREAHKSGKCVECGKLMRLSELERHMKYHTSDRPYSCKQCPRHFVERASLVRHTLLHTNEKWYKCYPCNKKILGHVAFEQHKQIHTKKNQENDTQMHSSQPQLSEKKIFKNLNSTTQRRTTKYTPEITTSSFIKQNQNHSLMNSIQKKYNLPLSKYICLNINSHDQCFSCGFCQQQFSTLRLRTRHILLHHRGQNPYQCQFCEKSFLRSSSLTQHSIFHTQERPFKCNLCCATFRYHSNLYSHRFTHQEYGSLTCTLCGQLFKHTTTLWSHVQRHRQQFGNKNKFSKIIRYYPQNIIKSSSSSSSSTLIKSKEKNIEEEQEVVEYNTPTFLSGEDVELIHNLNENVEKKQMECSSSMDNNIIKTENPEIIPTQEPSLSQELNIEKVSLLPPIVPIPNPIKKEDNIEPCGSTSTMITKSKMTSSCDDITMCPICYKSFPYNSLQIHLQLHNNENKPHQCQYCDKSYSKKFEVIQHEYSHTGERPYTCDDCGNTFRYKSNWCRHRRGYKVNGKCDTKMKAIKYHEINHHHQTFPFNIKNIPIITPPQEIEPCSWELIKFGTTDENDDDDNNEDNDNNKTDGNMDEYEYETSNNIDPLSEEPTTEANMNDSYTQQYNLPDIIIDEVDDDYIIMDEPNTFLNNVQQQKQINKINQYKPTTTPTPTTTTTMDKQHNMNMKQFWCFICQKGFESQRYLSFHKRQHIKKDRRVVCKICNKSFAHRFSLTQHSLIHTGEMPFSCNICKKQFRFKSNFTKHNKQHHPEILLIQSQSQSQKYQQNTSNHNIQFIPQILQQYKHQLQQEQQYKTKSNIELMVENKLVDKMEQEGEHTGEQQELFKCKYCKEKFEDSSEQRLHILSHKLGLSYVRTGSINTE